MRRGEIWVCVGGLYTSKPRPVIVMQSDFFDAGDSVVVCPLSSYEVDAPAFGVPVLADEHTSLEKPSFAMVDKIGAIRRVGLRQKIGSLTVV